jgi:isocitrate dehydrogenase
MEKESNIVRIFTGSEILAQALTVRLNEIGISPIARDDAQSAARAGFATALPMQEVLFLRKEELQKAQPVIDAFMQEIQEEE